MFRSLRVLGLAGLLGLALSQSANAESPADDNSSPKAVFATFLQAVKATDLAAAKKCWTISDGDKAGVLDVLIGNWIAQRRLQQAVQSKFGPQDRHSFDEEGMIAKQLSDHAIDDALSRLKNADIEFCGATAKLRIRWPEETRRRRGLGFLYRGSRPIARFLRADGDWKIDANWEIGFQRPADFFEPAGWFYFNPGEVALYDEVAADINAGKIRTAAQAIESVEKRWHSLVEKTESARKARLLSPIDARFFAAWIISQRFKREYYAQRGSLWGIFTWSLRLMEADMARSHQLSERVAAAETHRDRMEDVQYEVRDRAAGGHASERDYLDADACRAQAEIAIANANGKSAPLRAQKTLLAALQLLYESARLAMDEEHTGPYKDLNDHQSASAWISASYWSRRWIEAETSLPVGSAEQLAAAEAYLERARDLEKAVRGFVKSDRLGRPSLPRAVYYRADAECLVARLKAAKPEEEKAPPKAARVRRDAAQAANEDATWELFLVGRRQPEECYEWSCHDRDAALDMATSNVERIAAVEHHLSRMKRAEKLMKTRVDAGRMGMYEYWATQYYVAEGEIQLAKLKAK